MLRRRGNNRLLQSKATKKETSLQIDPNETRQGFYRTIQSTVDVNLGVLEIHYTY